MRTRTRFAYVAGRFERRDEMHNVIRKLGGLGIVCTSRWVTEEPDISTAHPKDVEAFKCTWSLKDFNDVLQADTLIAFSEDLTNLPWGDGGPTMNGEKMVPALWARGGRHVEFGMAVAWEKRIVVIGPRENIFHWLPMVEQYDDLDSFLKHAREHNVAHPA